MHQTKKTVTNSLRMAMVVVGLLILNTGLLPADIASADANAPTLAEYDIPTAGSQPAGIVLGPDGNMWFTESTSGKIAKITSDGQITEYTIPFVNGSSSSVPAQIIAGPDNNLWIADTAQNELFKITTSGTFTGYATGTGLSGFLTVGPDNNIWFTSNNGDSLISKFVLANGTTTDYTVADAPVGITTGSDGNLWFVVNNGSNEVGKITPAGVSTIYPFSASGATMAFLPAIDPDGNMWVPRTLAGSLAKFAPDGTMLADYTVASPTGPSGAWPYDVVTGPDGNMWFTDAQNGRIGSMNTDGTLQGMYDLSAGTAFPVMIAPGADNTLWFTESTANKIGKLTFASSDDSGGDATSTPADSTRAPGVPNTGAVMPEEYVRAPMIGISLMVISLGIAVLQRRSDA